MAKKSESNILASNKKAYHDFEILEKIEAGIVLSGAEVKSVRANQANLKGAYLEVSAGNEVFVRNIHISPYKFAEQKDYSPVRKRKLLLNQKEIGLIREKLEEAGATVIPLDFHIKNNRIKLLVGICRGKKKHDKREELKKKSQEIEIKRALKKY
jgi:SsrA-binding protein